MKSTIIALAACVSVAGCATYGDGYGGGYGGGLAYDGYYDNFYGPIYGGYWGANDIFYYRARPHSRFVRDEGRHFRREWRESEGGGFHRIHGEGRGGGHDRGHHKGDHRPG